MNAAAAAVVVATARTGVPAGEGGVPNARVGLAAVADLRGQGNTINAATSRRQAPHEHLSCAPRQSIAPPRSVAEMQTATLKCSGTSFEQWRCSEPGKENS